MPSIKDIKSTPLYRIPTGLDEMDWLYGYTELGPGNVCWGMPVGHVSLFSGKIGEEKGEVAREMAKSISRSRNSKGLLHRVIYFHLDKDRSYFIKELKRDGTKIPDTFYVSEETSIKDQIDVIKEVRAQVVFIDSLNEVEECWRYSGSRTAELFRPYRQIAVEMNGHVILNFHMKDGRTKHYSQLPYLVDTEFEVKRSQSILGKHPSSCFEVSLPYKNRQGRTGKGFYCVWQDGGYKAEIISTNRYKDEIWAKSH